MGSVCDKCFGSSDDRKPSQPPARQRPKFTRGASLRQNSTSTQQLTEHEYGGYGSQYDACAHRQEEHLPPSWCRPRFGSDESTASSGARAERFNPAAAAAAEASHRAGAGKVMTPQRKPAKITRQTSLDNEAPVRKLSRKLRR